LPVRSIARTKVDKPCESETALEEGWQFAYLRACTSEFQISA
jgi:hypothetical protein